MTFVLRHLYLLNAVNGRWRATAWNNLSSAKQLWQPTFLRKVQSGPSGDRPACVCVCVCVCVCLRERGGGVRACAPLQHLNHRWYSQNLVWILSLEYSAVFMSHNQPLQILLYLCITQLHVSAIRSHHQAEHRIINKKKTIIQYNKIVGKRSRLTLIYSCTRFYIYIYIYIYNII